ncbi:MAG: XRE family transcriptional regulator [Clostridia bacterium]|nr:XRE family transcriptional regulator [Clostridia bacterium]
MGTYATKASSNPWYKARMEAAKYNDRLRSREGAAELLGMSVSSIAETELDMQKAMPADKAILMADLYNAPELINYYCLHECPIGCRHAISDELCDIDRLVVKLMTATNGVEGIKAKLLGIAEDGRVDNWELKDFKEVSDFLDGIAKVASEAHVLLVKAKNRNDGTE